MKKDNHLNPAGKIQMASVHRSLDSSSRSPGSFRVLLPEEASLSLETRRDVGVDKVFGRSWWDYFLIGFAGPLSNVESVRELKPLEPGEALQTAWASTSERLAKWNLEIQNERKPTNSNN